ncbi:MAG: glycosyltransferase family 4 protein [Armatimonadota bacterium]
MRIVQLTAGTGSFYCGTCIRDNALVSELRRRGHDALLVPMYLPLALDEPPATAGTPVLFGGINVYLQQKLSLFRRTPRWLDRLFDSPALLRAAGRKAGMTSARELGELTLSMLRGEEGHQAKEVERLVEWMAAEGKPDVICLSNALLLGLARRLKERTGAAIVCLLQGEDTFLDALPEPERSASWAAVQERAADVNAFLPVSRYYGDLMCDRARLPREKVHPVYPGILLDGYTPAATRPDPPVLGYLARMCAAKGLETLVEAYLLLRARDRVPRLQLRVAGACTAADEVFVERMKDRLSEKGLAPDTRFLPNVSREEKIELLRGLSVFSVPATYGESFGLYVLEALAAGVPVVQPRHAAFPELIAETGGGVLCEPDDPLSLAEAIEELLLDPDRARALGAAGREAVLDRFSVARMAAGVEEVFSALTARSR